MLEVVKSEHREFNGSPYELITYRGSETDIIRAGIQINAEVQKQLRERPGAIFLFRYNSGKGKITMCAFEGYSSMRAKVEKIINNTNAFYKTESGQILKVREINFEGPTLGRHLIRHKFSENPEILVLCIENGEATRWTLTPEKVEELSKEYRFAKEMS